jgi:hypothetical protein
LSIWENGRHAAHAAITASGAEAANAAHFDQGAALVRALIERSASPFPRRVFFPAPDTSLNVPMLAFEDLRAEDPERRSLPHTIVGLITSHTPSSLNAVPPSPPHRGILATRDGMGRLPIPLPLANDDFRGSPRFLNHDADIHSTLSPSFSLTKWRTDYSGASSTVHHFTGVALWLVCPYTPETAGHFIDPTTREDAVQDPVAVLRSLPFVYATILSAPTAFILSPLDHYATLTLEASHHCGGKVLLRHEHDVFLKTQDYFRRLTALVSMQQCSEGLCAKASEDRLQVVRVVKHFLRAFGPDALLGQADDVAAWPDQPFDNAFLVECGLDIVHAD